MAFLSPDQICDWKGGLAGSFQFPDLVEFRRTHAPVGHRRTAAPYSLCLSVKTPELAKTKHTGTHFGGMPLEVHGLPHQQSLRCFLSVLSVHYFILHNFLKPGLLLTSPPQLMILSPFQFS